MNYEIELPKKVSQWKSQFEALLTRLLEHDIKPGDIVTIDISRTVFFASELTAILSAIIERWLSDGVHVKLTSTKIEPVDQMFRRNGFYSSFKNEPIMNDAYGTYLPLFSEYSQATEAIEKFLNESVFKNEHWPANSSLASHEMETINSAIFEIARNINEHSGSNRLFMCGQFYPTIHQLRFTLVDTGSGIADNVYNQLSELKAPKQTKTLLKNASDASRIDWATDRGNSTKANIASGMGLYDIKSSLLGHGEFTIVANSGFWKQTSEGRIIKQKMNVRYHGTILHLLFNIDQNRLAESSVKDDTMTTEIFF